MRSSQARPQGIAGGGQQLWIASNAARVGLPAREDKQAIGSTAQLQRDKDVVQRTIDRQAEMLAQKDEVIDQLRRQLSSS